jgi:outer membrane protein assembly complex protein YaeT
MKVSGVILALLLPWLALAQQQYYGTRISNITLSGTDSQTDLGSLPIHSGDILTSESVRAAIQALYDTGHYSYIEVEAMPAGDGSTALTFQVKQNYFFSTFSLEPDDLLDRSLSSYIRLPIGERFRAPLVDRVVKDTTDLLKNEGYFNATVSPKYKYDDTTRLVSVTLKAMPGTRAKVGTVRVQGGEDTFTHAEVLKTLGLKTGSKFSSSKLDKGNSDIRAKFAKLGFINTRVTANRNYKEATNTVDLDITVQPGEFALVDTVGYKISSKELKDLVPIFEEGTVGKDLIDEGGESIAGYMRQRGYYDASVTSETIQVEPPLGNAVQVNYTVSPGPKHGTATLEIEGNHYFTTDDIRNRIKTRPNQFLKRAVFSSQILDEDKRTIEAMYNNAGFEGTVVTTSAEDKDHTIHVTIQIQEGKQLHFESVSIMGNTAFSDQQLRDKLGFKPGDPYAPAKVDQARAAITQLYYTKGYADVAVERTVERVESSTGISVSFDITEGQAYQVGAILVMGNTLTKEKVIRRNSGLQSYRPYDPGAVLEAQQRLYATGLFSRVEIVALDQGIAGVRNLLIQVEDAKPILLTYGLGYQEFEHARGTFEITHNNLLGLGRSISLRTRLSTRERLAQSTFKEPRLFNHDLDGFVSAFIEHTEQPSFTANRIDFSVQTLKRLTLQRNLLFTAGYQTVDLQDIRVNIHALTLPAERGIIQIARVGASYVQDRRDDPANPTSGFFSTTTFQVATRALGSEINFTSLYNEYNTYRPVGNGGVFVTSARIGWNHPFGNTTQTGLPPTERYFAGGSTTLRGYGFDDAQPLGGNVMTLGNLEYRFPLRFFPISGVRGAAFYDTGNVFPQLSAVSLAAFSHTVGFGFRYQTPLGPVRLDFGVNLNPDVNGVKTSTLHVFFTLGNPF